MMKWGIRILAGLAVLMAVCALGTYLFVRGAVVEMFGGNTETALIDNGPNRTGRVAILNTNVLSPTADSFREATTVLIEDGIIAYVGSDAELPPGVHAIDGEGMYLVPGFTDSHVHLWKSENDLLLYLANGVTQVREMHGTDLHLKWRNEIENGRLGPDIFVIAAQLATYDFAEGIWVDMTAERNVVRSDADVRKTVADLTQAGFDGLKASSYLSKPAYQSASAETRSNNAPLVGHIPVAADLDDLWASNQSEVAHVEEFVKALDREFGGYNSKNTEAFLEFVRQRSAEVASEVAAKDIAVTTTLDLIQSFAGQMTNIDEELRNVHLEYVNPGIAEGQAMGWLPHTNRYRIPEDWKHGDWKERYTRYWTAYAEAQQILFTEFLRADVNLFAGTDANVPVMVPGFSMHDEMEAMQAAGMSPAKVLYASTTAPAEWMGLNTGKIENGLEANLVLLRDNPLDDITATRSIETVLANGAVLDRNTLDELLQSVLKANADSRKESIDPYS